MLTNRSSAGPSSSGVWASSISTATPWARAPSSTFRAKSGMDAPVGLDRKPIRSDPGTISVASSSNLPIMPSTLIAMPVTLPLGRA
jgi:hypothetical protein